MWTNITEQYTAIKVVAFEYKNNTSFREIRKKVKTLTSQNFFFSGFTPNKTANAP